MAAFSFAKLLTAPSTLGPLSGLPAFPEELDSCTIVGPKLSKLTSVALQFAANHAACASNPDSVAEPPEVVYLCQKGALEDSQAVLAPGCTHASPALRCVKIRHLSSALELQQYAGCLHLLPTRPAAVVVDGLSGFWQEGERRSREAAQCRTLALLRNGVEAIRVQGGSCPLLVTDEGSGSTAAGATDSVYILQRWTPLILQVQGTARSGLTMRVHPACAAAPQLPEQLRSVVVSFSVQASLSVTAVQHGGA